MLNDTGFKDAFQNGVLYVYSGAQPASADAAPSGTLLGLITLASGAFSHGSPTNGLNWDTPANGSIAKPVADAWSGLAIAQGTAGWARFCGNAAETFASSTTLPRVDFAVGKNSGDVRMANIDFEIGDPMSVTDAVMNLLASK